MTKLHELIAVEPDLKTEAHRAKTLAKGSLESGQEFLGEVRTYQPLSEDGELFPDEVTNLTTTVFEVLKLFENGYKGWLNVGLQKEITNTETQAEVVVGGEVLFTLPATGLLNLEAKLSEIRSIYKSLPVLDLTETWHYDQGQEVFVSEPRITFRTQKLPKNHVLSEATKEHPAQVQVFTEDVRVGTWEKILRSGAVTEKQKRVMLNRIDVLIRAVKQARQRANSIEAITETFSDKLFAFINDGEV